MSGYGKLKYVGDEAAWIFQQTQPYSEVQINLPGNQQIGYLVSMWGCIITEKSNERLLLLGDAPFSIDGLKRLAGGWFQLCLPTPTAKVSFVCCGWSHMIIITDLGMAYACGDNYHSQCGIQTSSIVTTPTLIDALKDRFISSASCGDAHTLFVTDKGVVYGCGDNTNGQVGISDQKIVRQPTQLLALYYTKITQVACGARHSLFLDDSSNVYSCGWGGYFQLGTENSDDRFEPDIVDSIAELEIDVKLICASQWMSCVVDADGDMYCVGLKAWTGKPWKLQNASQIWAPRPEKIDFPGKVISVSAGVRHMTVLVADSTADTPTSEVSTAVYRFGDVWPPQRIATNVQLAASTKWGSVFWCKA